MMSQLLLRSHFLHSKMMNILDILYSYIDIVIIFTLAHIFTFITFFIISIMHLYFMQQYILLHNTFPIP